MIRLGDRATRLALVLSALPLLMACALFETPTPILFPSPTPTGLVPTVGPSPAATTASTATPEASNTQPATPTDQPATPADPTTTPTPEAPPVTRIRFDTGATSATVEGRLASEGPTSYVLGIAAGQLIEISVTSLASISEVQMSIVGADGTVVKPLGQPFFRGIVPTTQDYTVVLQNGAGAQDFTLSVIIPVRIPYEAAGTDAVFEDTLGAAENRHYVIRAPEGETLTAEATTEEGEVAILVYGADGTVLQSGMAPLPAFSGSIPSTQDYIIVARAPVSSGAAYTLAVTLTPAGAAIPTPDTATATRLAFPPGATALVVEDEVPADEAARYLVAVEAGQLVEIDITPREGLRMEIIGADGTLIQAEGPPFFRGTVPEAQDYMITILAGPSPVAYALNVIIPRRITFDPGATRAEVGATLPPFTTGHFVIRAQGGQTMTVETEVTQGEVILIVYGADGAVLQTDHAGSSSFSGEIPSTQDYLINVRSVGSADVDVTMTVTIPPP